MTQKIAIIGAGAAGVMGALRGTLNNDHITLFSGTPQTKKKSRGQWVARVDNIPGYSKYRKGILNPNIETLNEIKEGPFKDKFEQIQVKIDKVEKQEDERFLLTDHKGETYKYDYVALATGMMDVQPHINGSIQPILPYANVQLVDYCLRCDGHHVLGKETTVIGHTDSAAWVAIMLYERYEVPNMIILTNGEKPEFSDEVRKLIELYHIEVETDAIIDIQGDAKARELEAYQLESGKLVYTQASFISLGMLVYNDLALGAGAEVDKRGFVLTNAKGQSNIENLYAIGDLQADKKKQIYTGWDTAVDALDDINGKIRRTKRERKLKNL